LTNKPSGSIYDISGDSESAIATIPAAGDQESGVDSGVET
jgi:hypothetical protein